MLVLDYFLISVIALSFGGAVVLIGRKFPQLASLDIDSIPSQRNEDKKSSIVEKRLERKLKILGLSLIARLKPLGRFFQFMSHFLRSALEDLERRSRLQKRSGLKGQSNEKQEFVRKTVNELYEKGINFLNDGKYQEAEKRFIEMLSYDPVNLDAFQALVRVYREQKEWDHAQDTIQHMQKIQTDNPILFFEQGEIEEARGNHHGALEAIERAIALEEKNPKYLTKGLELAIALRLKVLASSFFRKLKEVNPENQTLDDFDEQIKNI